MREERNFKLEPAGEAEFERMLKAGVYHELHARGLISDRQLSKLLERLWGEVLQND